jgi:hypothetical protein
VRGGGAAGGLQAGLARLGRDDDFAGGVDFQAGQSYLSSSSCVIVLSLAIPL